MPCRLEPLLAAVVRRRACSAAVLDMMEWIAMDMEVPEIAMAGTLVQADQIAEHMV